MKRIFVIVLLSVLAALVLRAFVFELIYVASASMEPTLSVGEKLIVEKLSFNVRNPRYGEIVVFTSPVDKKKDLIKRIIAVAGDTIEVRDKEVYRNGFRLNEPYVKYTRWGERLAGDNIPKSTVPSAKVFVLGDNRDESADSTVWKDAATGDRILFVPVNDIKGRILGKK